MRKRASYRLKRYGNLLLLRAAIGGKGNDVAVARLLVDTGSSYTILPVEVIEQMGYDLQHPVRRVLMASANGIVAAPMITVSWFNCLGQRLKNFPVVAHTIPNATFDGLLGMDFLTRCRAVIAVAEAEIRCQRSKTQRP